MKRADNKLGLLRSYALNEWARIGLDTENQFKRNGIAHGDILADMELVKRNGNDDNQTSTG